MPKGTICFAQNVAYHTEASLLRWDLQDRYRNYEITERQYHEQSITLFAIRLSQQFILCEIATFDVFTSKGR